MKYILSLGAASLLGAVLLIWLPETGITHLGASSSATTSAYRLSTSTLPVHVSGVVVASDRAVIAAEAAGVVAEYQVVEGQVVTLGALLARQSAEPVAAELELRQAEAVMVAAQQAAAATAAESQTQRTTVTARTSAELAVLETASADERVQESTVALLATDEAAVTTLLSALQYVNENRSLFTAESLRLYDNVVADVYGSIPNHFRGSVLRPVGSTEDVRDRLADLRSAAAPSLTDTTNVHALVSAQVLALMMVYEGAEADVFDRQQRDSSSAVYQRYFAERESLIKARTSLIERGAALQQALDTFAATEVDQELSVAVASLDAAAAAQQERYSRQIEEAAQAVAQAAVSVATAQYGLAEVRAPFSGVVVERYKEVGEYTAPGEPLLLLSGTVGRELTVTVPLSFVDSVSVGQPLMQDGEVIGVVNRFSPVSNGQAVSVVIALTAPDRMVGSTVTGSLQLLPDSHLYAVERAYVQFGGVGPVVETIDGETLLVDILYDTGEMLYVSGTELHDGQLLRPVHAVTLR